MSEVRSEILKDLGLKSRPITADYYGKLTRA